MRNLVREEERAVGNPQNLWVVLCFNGYDGQRVEVSLAFKQLNDFSGIFVIRKQGLQVFVMLSFVACDVFIDVQANNYGP